VISVDFLKVFPFVWFDFGARENSCSGCKIPNQKPHLQTLSADNSQMQMREVFGI